MGKPRIILKAKADLRQIFRMREREIARADKATVRALDRFGAVVRQDARRSIGSPAGERKVQWKVIDGQKQMVVTPPSKPRPPGQPPRSRTKSEHYNLRKIIFLSNYQKGRVRIGPIRTGGRTYNGMTVPDLHEFGGVFTTRVRLQAAALTRQNLRRKKIYVMDSATGKRFKDENGKHVVEQSYITQVSTNVLMVEMPKNSDDARGQNRTFRMPKRPTMRPAMNRQKKKGSKIWADYYRVARRKR